MGALYRGERREIYSVLIDDDFLCRNAVFDQSPPSERTGCNNSGRLPVFGILGTQQFGEARRKVLRPFGKFLTQCGQELLQTQRMSNALIEDEFAPQLQCPLR